MNEILILCEDKYEAQKLSGFIFSKDGKEIQNLPEEFKKDKDVVSAAVNQYGYALNFVDDIFKDTKSIVLLSLLPCKKDTISIKNKY